MTPELKKRVQTASAGVAVLVLLLIFGGAVGAFIISAVLSIAMLYEFTGITLSLPDQKEKRVAILGSAWLFHVADFWMAGAQFALLSFIFLGMTAYFLFTATKYVGEPLKQHYVELMTTIFGLVYLGFLPTYLVAMRSTGGGVHWTMLFLLIVWSNDIGAYFAGKRFGKRPLYPHISPKKSWEGAFGGLFAAIAISLLYKLALFHPLSWFGAIAIPTILSVVAPVGDLAESFLKRAFDKKDSSSILPGHGGFLDRFDSVVFALPVMYALTRIF